MNNNSTEGRVKAVSLNPLHEFSKKVVKSIHLIKAYGVEGDAHSGKTVKHRSRVAQDPNQPNLRQVHLIHQELFEELSQKGFSISSGQIGENITTSGIDLLGLPRNTVLTIGTSAKIQITGLRNPCHQLDGLQKGLMKAVLDTNDEGKLIRKAGVMAVVLESGKVKSGDAIQITYPEKPYLPLERV